MTNFFKEMEEFNLRTFDGEKIERDIDENIIYTVKNHNTTQWNHPTNPSLDDWKARISINYGFVRAITDKNGHMLAYTCAIKIIPDPFSSRLHVGEWYAFEEYNIKQIKDFEIAIPRWIDDKTGVRWSYNAKDHYYTLIMPNAFGCSEHWFFTDDNHITSDYGEYDKTYKYNVKKTTPNEHVIKLVQRALCDHGLIPCPESKNKTR